MKPVFFSPIHFNALKFNKINSINVPEDFSCRSKDSKQTPYNVSLIKNQNTGGFDVHFTDGNFQFPIAEQEIMIWPDVNYMYVDNMYTCEAKQGNGLGTCLHLTNIIEMLENNLDRIEIISASSAIPFHIKCGFKPTIDLNGLGALPNLRTIANDKTPELSKYANDAKMLLKTFMNPKLKTRLANELILGYIKKAIQIKDTEEQKYLSPNCIEMVLSREDVLKNKKHYNKLFKKYNIDYEIS